jgi:hypothetical protein
LKVKLQKAPGSDVEHTITHQTENQEGKKALSRPQGKSEVVGHDERRVVYCKKRTTEEEPGKELGDQREIGYGLGLQAHEQSSPGLYLQWRERGVLVLINALWNVQASKYPRKIFVCSTNKGLANNGLLLDLDAFCFRWLHPAQS